MNLANYINAYKNTARNLKSVLRDWESIPSDLQKHYREELQLLLIRRAEAGDEADAINLSPDLDYVLKGADRIIKECTTDIKNIMEIDI